MVRLVDGTSERMPRAGTKRSAPGRQAAPGSILPEREYWPAILSALDQAGGAAHANDMIERVGELLETHFPVARL